MGRTATPNAVLKRRGSKKVRDEIEAQAGEVLPTFPLAPEGARAFARVCELLDAIGTLSPTYADAITILADSLGNIEIAARDIAERGHISITERGETKNPSFTVLTSQQQIAHRFISALGLTPATIGKLGPPEKQESNHFADL